MRRKGQQFAVVVTSVMLGLAAVSIARAHGGDAAMIHSCVKKGGEVLVVGADDSCGSNQTALDWNIQGPQGPTGETGAEGPRGPSDAWHVPGPHVELPDAEWHDAANLTLPPGSYVLTGRGSVGNINGNDWSAFCALRSGEGELTRMRVDMQEGPFNSTPFTLTAAVSLTETSNVSLACQNGTNPDGSVPNPAFIASNALTAIQVGTLH